MRDQVTEEPLELSDRASIVARCQRCKEFVRMKVYKDDLVAWKQGRNPKTVFPYLCDDDQTMLITGKCGDCLHKREATPEVE